MRRKKFTTVLTPEDWLDVTLEINKKELSKFALNYRAFVEDDWKEIYRVDNFHGFLHEQKFWRDRKPIKLENEEGLPIGEVVEKFIDEIVTNFPKYKSYFEESERRRGNDKQNKKGRTEKKSTRS